MSLPVCPNCHSPAVEPYAFSAGENVCRACGHRGPVATFHTANNARELRIGAHKFVSRPGRIITPPHHEPTATTEPERNIRKWWLD